MGQTGNKIWPIVSSDGYFTWPEHRSLQLSVATKNTPDPVHSKSLRYLSSGATRRGCCDSVRRRCRTDGWHGRPV